MKDSTVGDEETKDKTSVPAETPVDGDTEHIRSPEDVKKEVKERFASEGERGRKADEQLNSSLRSENERRRESTTRIRPILEAELQEIERIFVVSNFYSQVQAALAERIVILTGKEGSGKHAAACYLAYQLLSQDRVSSVYRVPDDLGIGLASLIKQCPHTFLIVRDAFAAENSFLFRSIKGRGVLDCKAGSAEERTAIIKMLDGRFSDEELRTLCTEIEGVDYDNLGGKDKASKARELIMHLERREAITKLIKVLKETRPDITWKDPLDTIVSLRRQLEESSSYLMLTVADDRTDSSLEKSVKRMLSWFSEQNIQRCRYEPPELDAIFEKHLQERLGKENAENWIEKHPEIMHEISKWHQPIQAVEAVRNVSLSEEEFRAKVKEISSGLRFHNEIASFFESLDDERKILALNLSLLGTWPESDFWHMHRQLTPRLLETATQVEAKEEGKEKEKKPIPQFGTPKSRLLEDIRAHTVLLPIRVEGKEYSVSHIEFVDERFSQGVQDYAKRNHPDFLERMISHLAQLAVEAQDDPYLRITSTEAIGLISRANWPYVGDLIAKWAVSDVHYVRAMAGHVLSRAYLDPETRIYTIHILKRWTQSKNSKWLWTAASTYKEMRHIDLDFALNGLEFMARHQDLSSLKTILPLRSAVLIDLDDQLLEEYLLIEAGINRHGTDPEKMSFEIAAYLKKIEEAEDAWEEIESVYNAVEFALIVIAFDYLRETINLLCDWVNEEYSKDHTMQLTGSLIWLSVEEVLTNNAKEEMAPNGILELINRNEESLDALAELLSGCIVQLFPIRLADNKRKSLDICLSIEEWAKDDKYSDAIYKLMKGIRQYLSDSPRILEYVDQLITKRWRSQRMSRNIRSLAQAILPQLEDKDVKRDT